MKNYWLEKKKKKFKGIQIRSTSGHTLVFEDTEWDCEKSNDTLEKREAEFDFTIDLSLDAPEQVTH